MIVVTKHNNHGNQLLCFTFEYNLNQAMRQTGQSNGNALVLHLGGAGSDLGNNTFYPY